MTRPTPPLTAAVIGCGRMGAMTRGTLPTWLPPGWAPLVHADAIIANRGVELRALCDVDNERLAAAAAAYGVTSCFTDYRQLLERSCPDIVTVATRTDGRAAIVVSAAEHGVRGIHIEKPLARGMAACDRALAALARHNVHATYGTTRRYMEIYQRARELVEEGVIGTLEEIAIENGRTLLLWNHPHSTDLLLFFAGSREVESVQATCQIDAADVDGVRVDADPVVDHACFHFANGVRGIITSGRGLNTRLSGSLGSIVIRADGAALDIARSGARPGPYFLDRQTIEAVDGVSGTQTAIAELVAAARAPRAPTIAHDDIRTGLLMLLAVAWSSLQGGRRVRLGDVPPEFEVTGRYGTLYA